MLPAPRTEHAGRAPVNVPTILLGQHAGRLTGRQSPLCAVAALRCSKRSLPRVDRPRPVAVSTSSAARVGPRPIHATARHRSRFDPTCHASSPRPAAAVWGYAQIAPQHCLTLASPRPFPSPLPPPHPCPSARQIPVGNWRHPPPRHFHSPWRCRGGSDRNGRGKGRRSNPPRPTRTTPQTTRT